MSEELEFRRRLAEHERRFLRPQRTDLDTHASAIDYRGGDTGAAVWERAVPAELADDPDRRFWATPGQRDADRSALLATPPTAWTALLLSSDLDGLLAAETHARELVARFEIWGGPPAAQTRRVVWRVAGNPVARARGRVRSLGELEPAITCLRAVLGGSERIYEPPHLHRRFQHVVDALFWSRRWRAIATSEIPARIPGSETSVPTALAGRSFDELDNPLEPWLQLAQTGYELRGVRAHAGERLIELAAPFPPPRAVPRAPSSERDPSRAVWSQRLAELRLACARGDLGRLRSELPLLPGDDEAGEPRLIHFAAYGGATTLELLAEHGLLELEARDRVDRTALMLAAGLPSAGPAGGSQREIDVPISEITGASACEWLLAAEADSEARDRAGRTALHGATLDRRVRCAEALLRGGVDVDARDHEGRTPLMLAVREPVPTSLVPQRDAIVGVLLDAGADADARDEHGWTALHFLAAADALGDDRERARGHTRRLAQRLVRHGARPSRDRAGRSPADLRAWLGHAPDTDGPFDPRTSVAAGPGPAKLVLDLRLIAPLLRERVPEPDDPSRPRARPDRALLDHWLVWADWLQSRGDPRGEIVATSIARIGRRRRKRRRLDDALARQLARSRSLSDVALVSADALAPSRPTTIELRRTHGFVTRAAISGMRMSAAQIAEAAATFLRLEPLLAELRVEVFREADWIPLVERLAAIEPAPRLRRLVLAGLPAELPRLDELAVRFPGLRSLWLIGAGKLRGGLLRWPALPHLRLRHASSSEWLEGLVELELDTPELTHLDLGLPVGSRTSEAEARGAATTLAKLAGGGLAHLRACPLAQDFAAQILACPVLDQLRTLELDRVRGTAIETLVHRVDRLRELEWIRVSVSAFVAQQRARELELLRHELPQLQITT